VTTRGLQEWACRLPHEVSFATAQRLLGWIAREPEVLHHPATSLGSQALARPDPLPPPGVKPSDWERVLHARQHEVDSERLRRLGPQLQTGEIVALTSDVGVPRPEKRRWLELCTACMHTATGYR
jgi:hypothetical protein